MQEECYFECKVISPGDSETVITNLECLKDCFRNSGGKSHCINSLIEDVLNFGICRFRNSSIPECLYDCTVETLPPTCPGQYFGIYKINNECELGCNIEGQFAFIENGTCSKKTEKLLAEEKCINEVFQQPKFILDTIIAIIQWSCTEDVSLIFNSFYSDFISRSIERSERLAPVQFLKEFDDDFILKTELNYENTRNRYPWVCSLRTSTASKDHLCAVTLL